VLLLFVAGWLPIKSFADKVKRERKRKTKIHRERGVYQKRREGMHWVSDSPLTF
jgi:hypothetical protein